MEPNRRSAQQLAAPPAQPCTAKVHVLLFRPKRTRNLHKTKVPPPLSPHRTDRRPPGRVSTPYRSTNNVRASSPTPIRSR